MKSKTILFVLLLAIVFVSHRSALAQTIYVAEEQLTRVSTVTSGGVHPFANGIGLVYGLAADSSGNIYVADAGDDLIRRITPSGTASVYASVFGSPGALAFDAVGNLYCSLLAGGVVRISPLGIVAPVNTGSGSSGYGLAFDAHGNLYTSGGNSIFETSPNGVVSTFATVPNGAEGLAFDQSGNLYVANFVGNTIDKITPGGVVSTFATGMDVPTDLAFDSSGNLFVCNISEYGPLGHLCEITPDGKVSNFAGGLDYPTAIVITPEPSTLWLSTGGLVMALMRRQLRRARLAFTSSAFRM